jgi:hypothetical protein
VPHFRMKSICAVQHVAFAHQRPGTPRLERREVGLLVTSGAPAEPGPQTIDS